MFVVHALARSKIVIPRQSFLGAVLYVHFLIMLLSVMFKVVP